jgi:hypothetical protein
LSWFNFKFIHVSGKKNVLADALSRMPGTEVKDAEDNCAITMLKPEYCLRSIDAFEKMIQNASECDPEVEEAAKHLKEGHLKRLPDGTLEWELKDGFMYYKG